MNLYLIAAVMAGVAVAVSITLLHRAGGPPAPVWHAVLALGWITLGYLLALIVQALAG